MIKDYFSELIVLQAGEKIKEKTIEVNKPLYHGGYHFYQHKYDTIGQNYTILLVTSDLGLFAVFTGYALLALGIIWQCWFIKARQKEQHN